MLPQSSVSAPSVAFLIGASDASMPPQLLRRMGYDAYIERRPYSEMLTTDERKGWMSALNADTETQTAGYAESMGW